MKKRALVALLCLTMIFGDPMIGLACNEEQSSTYIRQILFGDDAERYANNDNVTILLDALYLCSMQSNNQGQDKVDYLKKSKVSGVPKISTINLNESELLDCSHVNWETVYSDKKRQKARKKTLRNAVEKVFDFGFFEEISDSKDGKCEAFIKLLYYSHILADFLADSPSDTEIELKDGSVPAYAGEAWVTVNGNKPSFDLTQRTKTETFFEYSPLDTNERTGVAIACIGPETLGTNEEKDISKIYPSGLKYHNQEYGDLVETSYVYNRSHLIARALGGHDTLYNLITGTRYLNAVGMLHFEDEVRNKIKETQNHVIYRVTPVYKGNNKLATGVQMEAYSIEDEGDSVCFNVFCYNVQPGISIEYTSGSNEQADYISTGSALQFASLNYLTEKDLMAEMDETLEQLFGNDSCANISSKLSEIANDARNIDDSSAKGYLALKKQEYEYLQVLKENIPLMLKKESFFNEMF